MRCVKRLIFPKKVKTLVVELSSQIGVNEISRAAKNGALIKLRNVVKNYKTPVGDFQALKGISATFNQGAFIGVVGKSGAGKSTLVNMLTGVDHLTSGEVWVDGVAVHALNEDQMALWRGKNVGVVYQSFELMPTLSLLDNILLPMDFCGLYQPRTSVERAMHLLELVELEDQAHKVPSAVSGGQRQRAAIARALANDPQLIVADEPTGNLDSLTAETVFEVFEALVDEGKTIVMVTHDESLSKRFDQILKIADGQIVEGLN